MEILAKGKIDDNGAFEEQERDIERPLALLQESHEDLCKFIVEKFSGTPLDTEVGYFEGPVPVAQAIKGISSED